MPIAEQMLYLSAAMSWQMVLTVFSDRSTANCQFITLSCPALATDDYFICEVKLLNKVKHFLINLEPQQKLETLKWN